MLLRYSTAVLCGFAENPGQVPSDVRTSDYQWIFKRRGGQPPLTCRLTIPSLRSSRIPEGAPLKAPTRRGFLFCYSVLPRLCRAAMPRTRDKSRLTFAPAISRQRASYRLYSLLLLSCSLFRRFAPRESLRAHQKTARHMPSSFFIQTEAKRGLVYHQALYACISSRACPCIS